MPNSEHLSIVRSGTEAFNKWRAQNPSVIPELNGANLSKIDLRGVNLNRAELRKVNFSQANLAEADLSKAILCEVSLVAVNLRGAHLREANLAKADLRDAFLADSFLDGACFKGAMLENVHFRSAHLRGATFHQARLSGADFSRLDLSETEFTSATARKVTFTGSNLSRADFDKTDASEANFSLAVLNDANLYRTNLSNANLEKADLVRAKLVGTVLTGANLTEARLVSTTLERATLVGCSVFGVSVWNSTIADTVQKDLIITPPDQPTVTADNLELAQFLYLLLNNQNVRRVVDTIATKVVLILGRFTPERKAILNALRDALRKHNLLPVLFDFEKPTQRDITETVSILAHLARFVIADITDAKSIPQELQRIVPDLPSVPVQPLLQTSENEYGMFEHFRRCPWVLPVYRYKNLDDILATLSEKVIAPAEAKAKELQTT